MPGKARPHAFLQRGRVTVNSFQINSLNLTEAGSGTVERCLDSRGQMHVRNQV